MKTFQNCVNTKSKEFKQLESKYGYETSALLSRLNNMEIPSLNRAETLLVKSRNKQFDNLLSYLNSSDVIDNTGVVKFLNGYARNFNNKIRVPDTMRTFVNNAFQYVFSPELANSNIKGLKGIQNRLLENGISLFEIKRFPNSLHSFVELNQQEIDRLNSEKSKKLDNSVSIANGEQIPLFKLTKIQSEDEYSKAKEEWQFSPSFDEQQQLNILNTLTGLTFQFVSKSLLEGKAVNLFTKDVVNEQAQIITKKVYQRKLDELSKKGELGLQDSQLKDKLTALLQPETWNKFQQAVLNNLQQFGFQINKTGEIAQIDLKDEDFEQFTPTEEDTDDTNIAEIESIGKAKNFSDYGEYTISTKEKLSPRLKVWLSSIPSIEESFIPVSFPNLNVENTYIPVDIVINAINEATVGKRTPEAMIEALERDGNSIKNRYFLLDVAKRLKAELNTDSRIPNEFFSKFNQTKNDMVMVKTSFTPRRINNQLVTDENNEIVFDINNQVININRGDIPNNLRELWWNDFFFNNSGEENNELLIPKATYKSIYSNYLSTKDNLFKYFDENGNLISESNRLTVRQKLSQLFNSINVELNTDVLDKLIDGGFNYNKFKINESSIFNEKFGILGQIFSEFKPDVANGEKAFGSTGMLKLSFEQAKYVDNFMNTSAKDGKNRSIWAYGLNNPFTREMFEILQSTQELQNQRQEIKEGKDIQENTYLLELLKNHYSGQSEILNLLATLPTESLETFLNNFKWSIFNVTKSSVKGSKGKELKHMNLREFINSQIQLFTNSNLSTKINGITRKWSFKFLTTPSDKTTMFLLNTPDHTIELSQDLKSIKSQTIDVFYNKFLGEYNKIKAYLEGSEEYRKSIDDITTYEPKAFYHFAQFNVKSKFLWNNGKLKDLNEITDGIKTETYIKDKIKEQIEQDIAQTYKDWESAGLIENGKLITGVNQTYREKLPRSVSNIGILETLSKQSEKNPLLQEQYLKTLNESDRKVTDYLVADFAINKHLFNIEASMLVLGDPTMFLKNSNQKVSQEQFLNSPLSFWKQWGNSVRDNLSKRMAGLQGSGKEPNWQNETANTIVIQDPQTSSKIIEDLQKLNPTLADKFSKVDILDGQEFVTAEEDLHLKYAEGKITKSKYQQLLKKVEGASKEIEEGKDISEENQFSTEDVAIAQAQKPLVWALINDNFLKLRKVTYNKPSAFGLYPQFTQGLEIDKLRQSVNTHNKNNTRVDRIVMLSAAKLGAKSPIQNVFNTDGTLNNFTINKDQIDEIPRHYLRIQLEVPYKKSEEIRMLTQSVKLMFNEVLDVNFDASSINKGELSGKDLKSLHDSLYKQTFQLNYNNFLIDAGAKQNEVGGYDFEDYTKLQETLQEHAITQGFDLNELEGLSLTPDKKSFKLPLAFSAKADRYEKLLLSLINDIILQKIHGRSFVLASEAGFKPTKKTEIKEGTKANKWINYNKTNIVWSDSFDPSEGLLPQRIDPKNPNKTLPAQVLVSFKFFDNKDKPLNLNDFLYEKDRHKFINTKKLSPELLKIIGIRVPTQGHASMADIEIVGFIPDFMGDLIIAPQDFTKQMGSDFDIDKLYSYMYNYQYKEGELSRFTFTDIDEKQERLVFNKNKGAYDKIVSSIFGKPAKQVENFEKEINNKKIKVIQDQLQDIYHIVLSNKEVYLKMLEGITEGNLSNLANQFKQSSGKEGTELPSLSSDRYKVEEYFDNSASKLGVGIYSANSTFLSLIEGKDLFLQKSQKVAYTTKSGEEKTKNVTKPYPFIIKDNKGNSYNLPNISGANGVNKLISMFQSASVDNAKLKILSAISVDKNTMGVTAVMASLADDSIKSNGVPVYTEDYIIKFISQPSIKEYILGLNTGSDDVKKNPDKSWKANLLYKIKSKYTQQLLDLQGDEAYKTLSIPYQGYSEQDLDFGINQGILNTDVDKPKYLKMQYDILEQFEYFEKVANLLRKTQYLSNTDAKGTPQTIQEALFKKQNQIDLLETAETKNSPIVVGNIANIFDDLTDYLFDLGVNLPIQIYKGNNFNAPVLPYGTFRYEKYIKDVKTLQNKSEQDDFYNAQEASNLYNSFLSFIWSAPSLKVADSPISEERLFLIKDTETNKSLATEIEEFKLSIDYYNSPILKPLFNSLKSKPNKKDPSLKFIDFQVSVGLINPDTEIILSLEYLRNLNYPLFEKIIKYSLIVNPANSTTSLRKFIPNFYLEAVKITQELNKINKLLNTDTNSPNLAKKQTMPPVSPLIYQTFQHYPNYAQNIDSKHQGFNTDKSKLIIDLKLFNEFILTYNRVSNPYQFLSSYDSNLRKWRLYEFQSEERKDDTVFANYTEIPTLGDYNLSEFDAFYTLNTPKASIIPFNNPVEFKKEQEVIEQPIQNKEGVSELFESNPELANIGTPQQYSQYLDTIFPDSKMKDIVYHGSPNKIEQFDKSKLGINTGSESAKNAFFFASNPFTSFVYTWKTWDLGQDEYSGEMEYAAMYQIGKLAERFNEKTSLKELLNDEEIKSISANNTTFLLLEALNKFDEKQSIFFPISETQTIKFDKDYTNKTKGKFYLETKGIGEENFLGIKTKEEEITKEEFDKLLIKAKAYLEKQKADIKIYQILLNSKNPLIVDDKNEGFRQETYSERVKKAKKENNDSVIINNTADPVPNSDIFAVFEPEQIHILGSKQDIEGFKKFVEQPINKEIKDYSVLEIHLPTGNNLDLTIRVKNNKTGEKGSFSIDNSGRWVIAKFNNKTNDYEIVAQPLTQTQIIGNAKLALGEDIVNQIINIKKETDKVEDYKGGEKFDKFLELTKKIKNNLTQEQPIVEETKEDIINKLGEDPLTNCK